MSNPSDGRPARIGASDAAETAPLRTSGSPYGGPRHRTDARPALWTTVAGSVR